jgi:hypothetical protein
LAWTRWSIRFPLIFQNKLANNLVHHEINFIKVPKAIGEAEKYFVGCGPIGHQGVYAARAIALLCDSIRMARNLESLQQRHLRAYRHATPDKRESANVLSKDTNRLSCA